MEISERKEGSLLELTLTGRIDTVTAPDFTNAVNKIAADIQKLILNMKGIDYISSAGLRVIMTAQKLMDGQGELVINNPSQSVVEVLEITGFIDMLNIQYECA